jgi:hypothetical protein
MPIVRVNRQPPAAAAVPSSPPPRHRPAPTPVVTEVPNAANPAGPEREIGTYEVGYRKPPKHSQFKQGKSGNPRGRPKGARGLKTIARKLLTEKVSVRTANGPKRMTKMEAALLKITEKAFAGDMRALTTLMQLYDTSVPDEVFRGSGVLQGEESLLSHEHEEAALAALRDLIRDEVVHGNGGNVQ